jgi:DNA (cytosine-5)-methyltransferase 1
VKPRLLDLFSGEGGAARGYQDAGFYVVGVDLEPMPRYCGDEFIQADALAFLDEGGAEGFDVVHASPPCQFYSRMRHLPWLRDRVYWDSIPPTIERLRRLHVPWVIENVMGAPLDGIWLCGLQFDLPTYRHRLFGSSQLLFAPSWHPKHPEVIYASRHLNRRYNATQGVMGVLPSAVGHTAGASTRKTFEAMGIGWMSRDGATQAVPPAFTEYIGRQLLAAIEDRAA